MSPNLMGNKKNPPQDNKLTTRGKYQKYLPYFDNTFLSTIASHYFLQTLHETSINDNIGVDIWML